jgi:TonB family protein
VKSFAKVKDLPKGLLASVLLHLAVYGTAFGIIAWNEAHAEFRTNIDQSNAPLLTLETHPPPPPEPWVIAKKVAPQPTPLVQPTPTPEEAMAVVASRLPSWTGGIITEGDYPVEMRKEKKEGRVIVEVLIDVTGQVKSVNIVRGGGPQFDQVVLDKLKGARFRPALDKLGQPINCRVRIPISFKLD